MAQTKPVVRASLARAVAASLAGAAPAAPEVGGLLLNGSFSSDTAWTKGSGWSISGGKATRVPDAVGSVLSQVTPEPMPAGTYRAVFTISGYVAGAVQPRIFGSGSIYTGSTAFANGEFTRDIVVAVGEETTFGFNATAATSLSIEVVSLARIA